MKKVFLDTNVFIDFLARRGHFFSPAAKIVQLSQDQKIELLVSALSFATASFILESHHKLTNEAIVQKFAQFIKICNVTPVDSFIIDEAITSQFSDFEDAMQHYSAKREGADAIITRNCDDFSSSQIEVYEPQQFLDMLTEG